MNLRLEFLPALTFKNATSLYREYREFTYTEVVQLPELIYFYMLWGRHSSTRAPWAWGKLLLSPVSHLPSAQRRKDSGSSLQHRPTRSPGKQAPLVGNHEAVSISLNWANPSCPAPSTSRVSMMPSMSTSSPKSVFTILTILLTSADPVSSGLPPHATKASTARRWWTVDGGRMECQS